MKNSIMIIGASGMVGSRLINLIKGDNFYEQIVVVTRRAVKDLPRSDRLIHHIVDFDHLEEHKEAIKAETLVSVLGTTARKAGSRDKFIKVDYGYPRQIAEIARENGAENIILVSSIGADPDSRLLYPGTKGRLERAVLDMGFESVNILRPSLLLGDRQEFRPGEEVGKYLARGCSFMLPEKYRPIEACAVAEKIINISKNPVRGVNIFEGKALYI